MSTPIFEKQNLKFQSLIKKIVSSGQQVSTIVNDKNYQKKDINIALIKKNFKTLKRSVSYAMEFVEIYLLRDRKTDDMGHSHGREIHSDDPEIQDMETDNGSYLSEGDSFNSNFANSLSSSLISISERERLFSENQELQAKVELLMLEMYGMESSVVCLKKKLKRLSVFEQNISLFDKDIFKGERDGVKSVVLASGDMEQGATKPSNAGDQGRGPPLYRFNYGMRRGGERRACLHGA